MATTSGVKVQLRQSTLSVLFIILCVVGVHMFIYCTTHIDIQTTVHNRRAWSYRPWNAVPCVTSSTLTSSSPTLTSSTQSLISPSSSTSCETVKRIVFIKTHKTGSTTTASVLERFGYTRNLSFATPSKNHIFSDVDLFAATMVQKELLTWARARNGGFDMLVNHARYERTEMDAVVPNAKYISIIRNPVMQLESAFGYYEMGRKLQIRSSNPFSVFMSNPRKYYSKDRDSEWYRRRNEQLYDFGFDHDDDENMAAINATLDRLSDEIDLVMITEYYDESLILLKKLLCWEFNDILYLSNGIRSKSHRNRLRDDIKAKIRLWNAADVMLYEHFNRTLWRKIGEYGPTFQADLDHFRVLEQRVKEDCVQPNSMTHKDKREDKLVLKSNSTFCRDLLRGDVEYTKIIKIRQNQGLNHS